MKQRTVIVSVINDLATDQRVKRTCDLLYKKGFAVLLTGRKLPYSLPLPERPYKMHRRRMLFTTGPLFYVFFNIRLFFFLLFHKASLLYSNDLDTLLPNFLIARIKRVPLVYDSHEFFTGVPELVKRPKVRKVWETIEKRIFPRLQHIVTVNNSIAGLYEQIYGVRPVVVRNVPFARESGRCSRRALGLPEDKKIVILQGSGINVQRGAEEAVEAMRYTEGISLLIVGKGDVMDDLKKMAENPAINGKVIFIPQLPFEQLVNYTACADAGLTLDKDSNINYRLSLPNKIFDYIQARIPILASNLPEIRAVIEEYDIGMIIKNHSPKEIAECMREILDSGERAKWLNNLRKAAETLTWENEKVFLEEVIEKTGVL